MSPRRARWLLGLGLFVAAGVAPAGEHVDAFGDPLPPTAIARLGTVRWRQPLLDGGETTTLSFSPDGKLLAVVSDGRIGVCEVPGGRPVTWFPAGPGTAAVFTSDGKSLLTEEP